MTSSVSHEGIKMCSVALRGKSSDYSKRPYTELSVQRGLGTDMGGQETEAIQKPNSGTFSLSVGEEQSQFVSRFQRKRPPHNNLTKTDITKTTSLNDESNFAAITRDSSRPSSALSVASNSNASDTSEDSLFTPVVSHTSSKGVKRAYAKSSSDDEAEFIPVTIKKNFEVVDDIEYSDGSPDEEEGEEFTVEKILDMKYHKGVKCYFVKWKDYSSEHNTWEPESNMTGCHEIIDEFMRKKMAKPRASIVKKNRESSATPFTSKSKISDHSYVEKTAVESRSRSDKEMEGKLLTSATTTPDSTTMAHEVETNFEDQLLTPVKLSEPETVIEVEKVHLLDTSVGGLFTGRQVYILRVWDDNKVKHLHLDITKKSEKEQYYNLVITEDVRRRCPEWLYGASLAVDGKLYCLVKFVGFDFVDVVAPQTLFKEFPYLLKFYLQTKHSKSISKSLAAFPVK